MNVHVDPGVVKLLLVTSVYFLLVSATILIAGMIGV